MAVWAGMAVTVSTLAQISLLVPTRLFCSSQTGGFHRKYGQSLYRTPDVSLIYTSILIHFLHLYGSVFIDWHGTTGLFSAHTYTLKKAHTRAYRLSSGSSYGVSSLRLVSLLGRFTGLDRGGQMRWCAICIYTFSSDLTLTDVY